MLFDVSSDLFFIYWESCILVATSLAGSFCGQDDQSDLQDEDFQLKDLNG